jgi:putative mRNA 3-end processing factor
VSGTPPAMCWDRRRSRSKRTACASSPRATTSRRRDPTCATFEPVKCDVFITEATFGLPVFRHPDAATKSGKLLKSVAAILTARIWSASIRWARRNASSRLIRDAGYDKPLHIHGALQKLCDYYQSRGIDLGACGRRRSRRKPRDRFRRRHRSRPALGLRRQMGAPLSRSLVSLCLRLDAGAPRVRQRGVELPLVMSDHADWDELDRNDPTVAPGEVWVTHGREEALVRWCELNGRSGQAAHIWSAMKMRSIE